MQVGKFSLGDSFPEMTKENVVVERNGGASEWRTADPSPPLRSGRDDK